MLSATRKFAKSWVAAVLIGLLVISFAIFGINDAFNGNYTDDVIKAGSRTVSGTDFRREFDNFRKGAEEQSKQPITIEQAVQFGLDKRLLEELATREAFGEMLHKVGIRPSDKLVMAELRKIPAFFNPISGAFDKALYQQEVARRNPHRPGKAAGAPGQSKQSGMAAGLRELNALGANKRTVWTVPTVPFPGSHFAVYPPDLIRPCIRPQVA